MVVLRTTVLIRTHTRSIHVTAYASVFVSANARAKITQESDTHTTHVATNLPTRHQDIEQIFRQDIEKKRLQEQNNSSQSLSHGNAEKTVQQSETTARDKQLMVSKGYLCVIQGSEDAGLIVKQRILERNPGAYSTLLE